LGFGLYGLPKENIRRKMELIKEAKMIKKLNKELKKKIIKQTKEVIADSIMQMEKLTKVVERVAMNKITGEAIIKGLQHAS